jgi:iron complex transport system substrate-binding protein
VRIKVLAFIPGYPYGGRGFFMEIKVKVKSLKLKILFFILLFSLFTFHSSLFTYSHAETPNRIVSLAPGITEILFAAGLGDRIVGVTTFCDYPEEAKTIAKVGGMSNPSLEAVVRLRPDIVILTTDGNPKEIETRLRALGIKTHVFKSLTLTELPGGIRAIGAALDAEKRFDSLAFRIEQALTKYRSESGGGIKRVLFIIWPEPLIVAGRRTAIDDTIRLLGGVNIAESARSRYPKYSIEEIYRQSPDIIFIGKGHEDMKKLSGGLLQRIGQVSAVKNKKVFYVSDNLYRQGPRVIQGIEELAGHLNEKKDSRGKGAKDSSEK